MRIETNDCSDSKYLLDLKINGDTIQGYIDLGSQCTLSQYSEAIKRGITWTNKNLPYMRGIGNNIVQPLGVTNVSIDIQNIIEDVVIYIVDDNVIKYPILIGHSLTEKTGIIITKTTDALIFSRDNSTKLQLRLLNDVTIQSLGMFPLPVFSSDNFSGAVIVRGSLRGVPLSEFYLLPGEYEMVNGRGMLLVQNLTQRPITLKQYALITRVVCTKNYLKINLLDFDSTDTASSFHYGKQFDDTEVERLKELLKKYETCFSDNLNDLGLTTIVKMKIELNDSQPVVYRPYRLSFPQREQVQSMVKEMVDADIVCESISSYASPVLLVKKKTGESRLCIDYRALNNKTRKEHYPLPLIDDQLDRLAGNSLFISLDLASGFYQIAVDVNSQDKTSFVTPDGQYQFKRMPFGLANAPSVFQRAMNKILSRVNYTIIYMDDVLIPARSFNEGITRLEEVLNILNDAGLTLKLKKCNYFCTELEFLNFTLVVMVFARVPAKPWPLVISQSHKIFMTLDDL